MSRIRVVVADQAEAILYDLTSLKARPVEVAHWTDPAAPRCTGEDHGAGDDAARPKDAGEQALRRELATRFARTIAERLDAEHRAREFQQLIVVASAPFRCMLRAELSPATKGCIVYEVPKDLVHSRLEVLLDYLPDRAQELKSA